MLDVFVGIASSSSPLWKEHRAFALSTLRDFGFGKRSLEGKILEEVEVFIDCIKRTGGKAFDVGDLLQMSVSNIISSVALGERFEHNDDKFRKITRAISEFLNNANASGLLTFLPFLRYIPGDPANYKGVMGSINSVLAALQKIIDDHRTNFANRGVTNYLDAYLERQKEDKDGHSTFTGIPVSRCPVNPSAQCFVFLPLYWMYQTKGEGHLLNEMILSSKITPEYIYLADRGFDAKMKR